MWIIPKNLHTSRYVADMKELGVDCEQFSQISEKSLMWRSKPTASPTWSKRWKRVSWIQHLSSLILKPSHSENFVERWTSSLEDSLVSLSQMQERVEELKTQDICSLTSETESGSANLELFSSKMLKELSQQKHPRENRFSNMSSENWKEWVITQRQEYSQRVKLAHLTRESESSSWATPNVCGNHNRKGASKTSGDGLSTQAKNWATPRASATDSTRPNKKGGIPLAEQAKNWATPNTMDTLPPRSYEAAMRQATTSRKGRTDPSNLREQVDETSVQAYKDAINFPTPRTSDAEGGRIETVIEDGVFKSKRHKSNQTFGAKLRDAVETHEEQKNWATPQSRDYKGARRKLSEDGKNRSQTTGETFGKDLNQQVQKKWATPRARDYKGGYRPESMIRKDGKSRMDALPQMVEYDPSSRPITDSPVDQESVNKNGKHLESQPNLQRSSGQLNPDWVEQLMGLTIGSTDLGSWGTELFHK